jgi:signal peptidase
MKKIAICPTCATKVECQGNIGGRKLVICPNCGDKGIVTFTERKKTFSEEIKTFTPKEKHRQKSKTRSLVAIGVIVIIATLFVWYVALPAAQGSMHFLIVLSGSMQPEINPGDIVVSTHISPEKIKEGDIITFKDINNQNNCITHRVINVITDDEGNLYFRTKGDANEEPDLNLVPSSLLIGKVNFIIPYLGYLPFFAKTPLGFFTLIILPGSLIILNEMYKIFLTTKKKRATIGGKK